MSESELIRPPAVFKKAVSLEHCLANAIGKQERKGAWVDEPLAQNSLLELDDLVENIEAELEPILPLQIEMVDTKVKGEKFTNGVKKVRTKTGFTKTVVDWFSRKGVVQKERGAVRKDGTKAIREHVYPETDYDLEDVVEGPFCRVGWFKFELTSTNQVTDFLYTQGWVPTEYNLKKVTANEAKDPASPYFGQVVGKNARNDKGEEVQTSPKLTEDSFDSIRGETGKMIADHRSFNHRKKFIAGILRSVNDKGMSRQGAITHGAVTGRMQHRVIVNTPRVTSTYGGPCRAIFCAKEPYWNFGADLSGLEDRMKAHYIYKYPGGPAYGRKILDPNFDVHQENADLWGVSRTDAKSPKYALDYNCGFKKLAKTLGVGEDVGLRLFEDFWDLNKPLKMFNDEVSELYKKRKEVNGKGWVKGIDGRVLFPRSPHSAGNMLFQSAGNIVAKTAVCLMDTWARKNNIDGWQWSFNHDEYQWYIHEKHINEFYWFDDEEEATEFWKEMVVPLKDYTFSKPSHVDDQFLVVESPVCNAMIQCFILAGKRLKIRVDTVGEAMVGHNWAQCH